MSALFRETPVWMDLGDGSIIDVRVVTGVGILLEPEEWDDAKHKVLWNRGYRTSVSHIGGAYFSKRPTEEVSAEVKSLTK